MYSRREIDCWHVFDGCARFVLRPDGEVVSICALGRQLVQAGAGIGLRDGKARLGDTPLTQALLERRMTPDSMGLLHRQDDRVVLGAFRTCLSDGQPAVALMLRLIDGTEKPRFACLAEAYQLTPAEDRIVLKLLGGCSPAEIAERECLSINTVRSHVAHVYGKLGVRNRDEMWVKCASFMVNRFRNYSSIINLYDARRNVTAYEAINR
ncbi:MAG: hypothetical protein RL702_415 [Pseudomonadota bacterium]|jgi:DNA-binding CsgD family transcriptional regulator|nr:LuxR C-terminal-related transcriptional regulator [Novosphingobium sp.]HOA50376.1 LuxR C-terminal-related transcriptional regulator [Novosphingobium sp.]HPZ47949.1 LuxR C-terminal-related transcriptional regulator [Novosphingobium sp.]HQE00327.1 LuxR C-terminal-related transcriptional regulator [Novosphingobium sp.]